MSFFNGNNVFIEKLKFMKHLVISLFLLQYYLMIVAMTFPKVKQMRKSSFSFKYNFYLTKIEKKNCIFN